MTGIREYQKSVSLNTLYAVVGKGKGDGSSLQPYIESVGGLVNIFGSVQKPDSPPTGMFNFNTNGFVGIEAMAVLPNYLYFTQQSGTTTSIILSGIEAEVAT